MKHISTKLMSAAAVITLVACTGSGAGAGAVDSAGTQAGEARSISTAEKRQGAEAHPQLLAEFGGAYTGPQVPYVTGVGQNIAVQSGLGNARSDFTVTLLNSPVNNAFAIPGGYVYLTRQLMALMNDEAEMAGVLGHEVGHVAARHSEKRQKAATRNSIIGILGQIGSQVLLGDSSLGRIGQEIFGTGSQLLTLKYSREQEYEADDLGIRYLDGILYGDDPKQGVIEGNSFLHPDLRLKFSIPSGFSMQNGTRAVTITGSGGQGQFTTSSYNGNMATYIDAAFNRLAGEGKTLAHGAIERTTVNGLPASYAMARVESNNGPVDVTVFAYEVSKSSAYHFATIAPAGRADVFTSMYRSLTRLSASEAAAIRPRKVDVVTVKSGDTISSLSSRMAYKNYQLDRFLVLNRLRATDGLRAGQKVKIVTY